MIELLKKALLLFPGLIALWALPDLQHFAIFRSSPLPRMDIILKNIDNPQGDKLESKEVFKRHTYVEEALNRSRWLCVGDNPIYCLYHPRCLDHPDRSTS